MIKRLFGVVLCVLFALAITPIFYVYADESAAAIYTLTYDYSSDNGSTWTEQTRILNFDGDIVLYNTNQKIRIKSLKVEKFSYDDYLYFLIDSDFFSSRPSYNVTSGNARLFTFNDGVWGCLYPGIYSYTFAYQNTLSGISGGSITFHFEIHDSFNYDDILNEVVSWLAQIGDNLDSFYSDWSASFMPHFDNIWTFMTQTNYSYLSFAGNGAGLNSSTTKNPLLAMNGQLSALVRYFNKIQKNDYSFDSISYDSDGIGTVSVVQNVPWFDAMLGQLKGSSAIEQHHMEMENEALDAGANDVYQAALDSAGTSWGILGDISGIYQIGSPQTIPVGYQDALTAGLNWYSVENRTILTAPETPGDPDMRFSIFDLDKNRSIVFGGDNSDPG